MKAFGNKQNSTPSGSSAFFQKKSEQHFFNSVSNPSHFFSKQSPAVQTKLTIGQPNDKYEQEADAMADKVVQRLATPESPAQNDISVQTKPLGTTITPFIQTKCAACDQEEKLQKKEEEDLVQESSLDVQKKPIFESNAEPPEEENNIQRKCAECEKEDEQKIQPKNENDSAQTASPSIENSLSSSKGNGNPLPESTRTQMEDSFNTDFSNVRIHSDVAAVQMNRNLNAQAFTNGNDIYFNSGKFDVGSISGKHLLAHELTHTLQQNGSQHLQRVCDPANATCIPQSYTTCNPNIASCPPPVASTPESNPMELVQSRAPGSFSLLPISNPPDLLVSDIPEGQIVAYNAAPIPTSLNGTLPNMRASEFVGPGSSTLLNAVNQSLMRTGFAAVQGGNGIGLIAVPRLGSVGAAIPESLSTWGHTAAYVRINGQIAIVRGFTVESMMAAATNAQAVTSGQGAIAGTISNDLSMFTVTNARTIEWPVTADTAQTMAKSLPPEGAPPAGGPTQYTGRPGVYGQGASNCVGWACSAVEGPVGGKPATTRLGPVAEPVNPAEGLQGRMMQLTKTGAADVSPAGAVAGSMPLKFQILKWGGRLFLVVGAALTVHQVVTASGANRRETQGQAVGSFAGGVTVGAFAAGFCIGAGIATGGIALLVCGGVAAIAGTVGGHYAGGAIGRQFD